MSHIKDNATVDHLVNDHDVPQDLANAISERGRIVMHVGAHESLDSKGFIDKLQDFPTGKE